MSKLIGVIGETGSGKSTSLKDLNPKESYIISVAGKELPFKGSEKLYNRENKNYKEVESATEITKLLDTLSKEAPHIKNIVIDDANYIMGFNLVNKAMETGYTKFSLMAKDIVNLIQNAKKLRDDLVICYLSHSEIVEDGNEISGYKIKTAGKMLDSQIVLEGLFTVILYTNVETKGDKVEYTFVTNRYKKFPAKSPNGMFSEVKIPNNLQEVVDKVREYYK